MRRAVWQTPLHADEATARVHFVFRGGMRSAAEMWGIRTGLSFTFMAPNSELNMFLMSINCGWGWRWVEVGVELESSLSWSWSWVGVELEPSWSWSGKRKKQHG